MFSDVMFFFSFLKVHLKMMQDVAATRDQMRKAMPLLNTSGNGGGSRSTYLSPLKLGSSPSRPRVVNPGQLRSVGQAQSPLHALMLGRFSPLSLSKSSRATML